MVNQSVLIYEFSTGINFELNPSAPGGWVSRGFTGRYMNLTHPEGVPYAIERAIANQLLEATEGSDINKPAIIGRVIPSDDKTWSVVAIASLGRDDGGRPLSVYRYFFCEGEANLTKIVDFIEDYKQKNQGFYPIFKPQETGKLHQSPAYSILRQNSLNQPIQEWLETQTTPILNSQFDLPTIHIRSLYKANLMNQPVAWIYNAENVENPWGFIIIHTANQEGLERVKRRLYSTPVQRLTPVGFDEQKIKSAIKTLMSRIKDEAIKDLADVIDNTAITTKNWENWFDGQGANKAISQPISSELMARLLTLRAMILPKTLPDLLRWLEMEVNQGFKQASLDFQSEFYPVFKNITPHKINILHDKLAQGIAVLLPKLLEKTTTTITTETVKDLLENNNSFWRHCRQSLVKNFEDDLQVISNKSFELQKLISTSQTSKINNSQYRDNSSQNQPPKSLSDYFCCDVELWKPIIKVLTFLNPQSKIIPDYLAFGELFAQLAQSQNEYRISAYFYQVSQRKVPNETFINAFGFNNEIPYLGIIIKRDIPATEIGSKAVGNFLKNNWQGLLVGLIMSIIVFFLTLLFLRLKTPQSPIISENLLEKATKVDSIKQTRETLTDIKNNIKQEVNLTGESQVSNQIKDQHINKALIMALCVDIPETEDQSKNQSVDENRHQFVNENKNKSVVQSTVSCLNDNFLTAETLTKITEPNKEIWAKQIYKYQVVQNLKGDGILGENSQDQLEKDTLFNLRQVIKPKMFPQEQKNALDKFDNFAQQIQELINTKTSDNSSERNDVIQDLKAVLSLNSSVNYTGIIEGKWTKEETLKQQQQIKWLEALNSYQLGLTMEDSKLTLEYGILDSETLTQLEKDLQFRLNPTPIITPIITPTTPIITPITPNTPDQETIKKQEAIQKALPNFDKNTLVSLKQIEREISQEMIKERTPLLKQKYDNNQELYTPLLNQLIQEQIKNVLNDPTLTNYQQPLNDKQKKQWINAIYDYQKDVLDFGKPDGDMSPLAEGETYKPFKQEIRKKVDQELAKE